MLYTTERRTHREMPTPCPSHFFVGTFTPYEQASHCNLYSFSTHTLAHTRLGFRRHDSSRLSVGGLNLHKEIKERHVIYSGLFANIPHLTCLRAVCPRDTRIHIRFKVSHSTRISARRKTERPLSWYRAHIAWVSYFTMYNA